MVNYIVDCCCWFAGVTGLLVILAVWFGLRWVVSWVMSGLCSCADGVSNV